jgi:hypothetical protein
MPRLGSIPKILLLDVGDAGRILWPREMAQFCPARVGLVRQISDFEIDRGVFVGLVAPRTLDDALPLQAPPLRVLGIVGEGGILSCQGCFAGLAFDKPVLLHAENLSSSGISEEMPGRS